MLLAIREKNKNVSKIIHIHSRMQLEKHINIFESLDWVKWIFLVM